MSPFLKKASLVLVLLSFVFIGLRAFSSYEKKNSKRLESFALFSITKSGTHMARDLLQILTQLASNDHGCQEISDPSFNYYHFHLPASVEKQIFEKNTVKKKIFLVRDLRDVLVSFSFWMGKDFVNVVAARDKAEFLTLSSQKEKINWIMHHKYDEYTSKPWGFRLSKQAEFVCKYKDRKDVLLIRFENLVGSQGGGDDELQFQEVKKIAQFINAPIKDNDEELKKVASSIFGRRSAVFRKGHIGDWKEYFDGDLLQVFNEELSAYQKALGYS